MIKRIKQIFRDIFTIDELHVEPEAMHEIRRKVAILKKFNGEMHVSPRGALSTRFKTREDEAAYAKHVRDSFFKGS